MAITPNKLSDDGCYKLFLARFFVMGVIGVNIAPSPSLKSTFSLFLKFFSQIFETFSPIFKNLRMMGVIEIYGAQKSDGCYRHLLVRCYSHPLYLFLINFLIFFQFFIICVGDACKTLAADLRKILTLKNHL